MTTGDTFAFAAAFEVLRETAGTAAEKTSVRGSLPEDRLEIAGKSLKRRNQPQPADRKVAGGPRRNRNRGTHRGSEADQPA